jgi:hypothetical protein
MAWPAFLFAHGRFDEARAAVNEARSRGTPRAEMAQLDGELALRRSDRVAAANAFAEAHAIRPDSRLQTTLAAVYGTTPVSAAWLQQRIADTRHNLADDPWPSSRIELAVLLQAAGDPRGAIAALSDAVDKGWLDAGYLRASPLFSSVASDPAFDAVLAAIGRRVAAERERVLTAPWCPAELKIRQATWEERQRGRDLRM